LALSARQAARPRRHASLAPREPSYRARVLCLLVASLLLAGVIWGRLVYWQVLQHARLSADALTQYSKVVELPATRGLIYDRNGQPLAINETVYSIVVAPDQVRLSDRDRVVAALSSATGKPIAPIETILASRSKFAYIARQQPKTVADKLLAQHLAGVGLQPETRRSYLAGNTTDSTLASNLLGFVNNDGRFMESLGNPATGDEGVLQYLDTAATRQQPFFLVISLVNPHDVLFYPGSGFEEDEYDASWLEGDIGLPATVAPIAVTAISASSGPPTVEAPKA